MFSRIIKTTIFLILLAIIAYLIGILQIEKPERIVYITKEIQVIKTETIKTQCPKTYEKEYYNCIERYANLIPWFVAKSEASDLFNLYDLKEYNCWHFSKDFVSKMKEANVMSSIIIGNKKGEELKHAWACVWVEPQTGDFIGVNEGYSATELIK